MKQLDEPEERAVDELRELDVRVEVVVLRVAVLDLRVVVVDGVRVAVVVCGV